MSMRAHPHRNDGGGAVRAHPLVLRRHRIGCLDLTGGAPELHPGFRKLVSEVRSAGVAVIDRCNLTILNEPGHETLLNFWRSRVLP
jgi:hypothetical protein